MKLVGAAGRDFERCRMDMSLRRPVEGKLEGVLDQDEVYFRRVPLSLDGWPMGRRFSLPTDG